MSTPASGAEPAPGQIYVELKRARKQLDEAVAQEPGGSEPEWLRRLQAASRSLFEVLEQHQSVTEEEGGTLPEATSRKPGLMAVSKRLQREHTDMLHRANEIDQEVERQFAFQEFRVELLRREVAVLRDILELHLQRAGSVMYEAYFRVEGGEGG